MPRQPSRIAFAIPGWVNEHAQTYRCSSAADQQMHFVIEAARHNASQGGGPFAAAVFERDSGELISLGVNLVTLQGLSVLHAEIVAISLAQRILGSYDLGAADLPACRLVSSTEPCAMCLGAIPWSGVRELVTGAADADARAIGFDEGAKPIEWQKTLNDREIVVHCGVAQSAAREVLLEYRDGGGHIYNSRER